MKIIVAGCGNVGTNIVKNLAKEGHQIIAIDSDAAKLEEVADYYDAVGINGNAAILSTLKSADIGKCDLFIAVTASDEMNILSCNLAKYSGAKATAARLRNPEYSMQSDDMCKALNLDFSVNPELELAREISRKLRYPNADNVDVIVNGKAYLITVTVPQGSKIAGKKIMDLSSVSRAQALICAVERDGTVTIPKGAFSIREGDMISFAATPKNADMFIDDIGLYRHPPKNVAIIGSGATTRYLAETLTKININVKIMDSNQSECERLRMELPSPVTVVSGKATDEEVFEEERLNKMDAIISISGVDEENILVSLFAKTYKVPVIITKVQSETNRKLLSAVSLGTVLSPDRTASTILTKYARAMNVSNKRSRLIKLYNIDDKAEAVSFIVNDGDELSGKKIREIKFKNNVLCACIIRSGDVIIPNGDTEINANDLVLIVTAGLKLTTLKDAVN